MRIRGHDYRRAAFGDSWTDNNNAPGGHNGCDTRNDILDRDLVDKTYVSIKRCPTAVATGTLHDPYTNAVVPFVRGAQTGAAVQIEHIVPLAYAWDLGARGWTDELRLRFANDPANLLAVEGQVNQDKGDQEPVDWMPPNTAFHCQYAVQFVAVLRGYGLPIDSPSAAVLREPPRPAPPLRCRCRSRGPAGTGCRRRAVAASPSRRRSTRSRTRRGSRAMRSGDVERGMTTLPSWMLQRISTCAGDLPCAAATEVTVGLSSSLPTPSGL